ncbi:MAG: TM2 domain-containing protein [archaeon]|nr:TM2 domain-containing protein [archaeon]
MRITIFVFIPFLVYSYYIKPNFLELRKTDEEADTTYGKCMVVACGTSYCASKSGKCIEKEDEEGVKEKVCECETGYTTADADFFYKCCYKQKSLMTAFFLEVFLGFGAGHFYSGNTTTGVVKLIVYLCLLFSILAICIYRMKITDTERENSFIFRFIKSICFLVCGFTYLGWQMIDSILFTLEEFTDQNGQALYH